jgi:hypothetical protein
MGLHVMVKNLSDEDRRSLYDHIDQLALQLGYAVVGSYGEVAQVGSFERCQQFIDSYKKQDAICGCCVAEKCSIVEVSSVHKTRIRTWFLDQIRYQRLYNQSKNNFDS